MSTLEIKSAPLIPITETVIYPGISNRIFVNEDIGNNIKELIIKNNTLAIGLSTKDYKGLVQLTADSFYRIGVLMKFDNIQKSDNGFIIDITTINRVKVLDFTFEEKQITASYTVQDDILDINADEEQEMIVYIKGLMKDLSHNFKGAEYFVSILEGLPSLEEIMGYTIPMMGIPLKSKQVLLEIDSLKERALSFIDYIIREKDSVHLQLERATDSPILNLYYSLKMRVSPISIRNTGLHRLKRLSFILPMTMDIILRFLQTWSGVSFISNRHQEFRLSKHGKDMPGSLL